MHKMMCKVQGIQMHTPPGLLPWGKMCFLVLWPSSSTLQCLFPDSSIPVFFPGGSIPGDHAQSYDMFAFKVKLAVSRFDRRPPLCLYPVIEHISHNVFKH
eukprot:1161627-Pelagomonas_calceolata.AAC.9